MSNANEPAYPVTPPLGSAAAGYPYPAAGLTKREAFAMAALQGYIARGNAYEANAVAERCVALADALVAALEQRA